jgi:hypothetical protein
MKSSATLAVVSAALLVVVGFAAPALGADNRHYTVHCAVEGDATVVARAFDASMIETAGGKAHAIELFKQQHPDGHCWVSGPHLNVP